MKFNWMTLLEALKEPGRILFLALITWAITFIVPQVSNPTWSAIILLVLRGIDSYLHELGKETGSTTLTRGITQF